MFVKLDLIAQILDPKSPDLNTYYFFSKKYGILLPIETNKKPGKINPMTTTFFSVLKSFCIKIKRVIIYLHEENRYYTYLSLERGKNNLEFNCDLLEILDLYPRLVCPIFIKKDILTNKGIRVTKRMLLKALSEDIYLT
jgi:bifunctional DNase/RNase